MTTLRRWVLIADGARARIVTCDARGHHFEAIEGMTFETDHRPTRDLASDRQGRTQDSHEAHRHAMEWPSDPHRELKRAFAGQLADVFARALGEDAFDRLVVVAPARTMGDLRDALSDAVKARVDAEVVSDLTKVPNTELAAHLADVVRPPLDG